MVASSEIMQNISHSLSSYLFSKNLRIDHYPKAQILEKLSPLLGLVYLENDSNPVIAFLPHQYLLMSESELTCFKRDELHYYHKNSTINSIQHFVQFRQAETIQSSNLFQGGYIGFVDYNHAAEQSVKSEVKSQPQFYLGQYDSFIRYENSSWIFVSHEINAESIFELIVDLLHSSTKTDHQAFQMLTPCEARWSKTEYQIAFQKIQDYILAGDCYQINLTQEFQAQAKGLLIKTAEQFWALTNAPYSGYLKLDDFEVLSCSPELFIDFKPNREIITKPIKGTMPRFADPVLDQISKQKLINSKKDQAENVMIVDLLRNDLSVYAETGSVKTTKLFDIESFNQVHHMVSEVRATLKEEAHPFEVLMSALPGGSITGAPKIRAMQIIEELEGSPRGAYCGSMGYFNYDGTGSWNILIRTIQKQADNVSIWAGGGITISSESEAEYQECFDKVSALLDLINTYYPSNSQ